MSLLALFIVHWYHRMQGRSNIQEEKVLIQHQLYVETLTVNPGDVIFGDSDGVLVGSAQSFASILHDAENIVTVEEQLIKGMKMGVSLHKMTNFEQHVRLRKEGKESKLEFRDDLHTIKFDAEPIHYD